MIASEPDDAEAWVRASVNIYGYGAAFDGSAGAPPFPSIVSAEAAGAPIGWVALGG